MSKRVVVENLPQKSIRRRGVVIPGEPAMGHHAEIVPGVSIRLYGIETNRVGGPAPYDRTFRIGDEVEYHSYNLSYTGKITSITAKGVGVQDKHMRKTARLDLYTFSWRNRDLDLAKIAARNADTLSAV
jgi:hypothetical protein